MRTGTLRHAIELQSAARASDAYGQSTVTWATYAHIKAQVKPLTGYELMVASQVQEGVSHKVTIWYRDDVTSEHRILFGTREFAILAVMNIGEMNEMTEMLCLEQPNG